MIHFPGTSRLFCFKMIYIVHACVIQLLCNGSAKKKVENELVYVLLVFVCVVSCRLRQLSSPILFTKGKRNMMYLQVVYSSTTKLPLF